MSNQIKIVYLEDNVVQTVSIGKTTDLDIGITLNSGSELIGVSTTTNVGFGYTYVDGSFVAPPVQEITTDEKWKILRERRDERLAGTDWRASSDLVLSDEWKTYRQALRDLPANTSDPGNPTWPTKPS
tara:strand:- start:559 stop:942 length:384 start_codon:yes stop_codon:yes gene_type:complete